MPTSPTPTFQRKNRLNTLLKSTEFDDDLVPFHDPRPLQNQQREPVQRDPWTAFKLSSALSKQDAGADAAGKTFKGANGAAGTLLQGAELPSDTDDSSFR